MNPSKEALDAELVKLENESGMEEYEIRGRLSALREDDSDCEPCKEWRYEMDAFHFSENYGDAENEWGTYFGPTFIQETQDGMICTPDIKSFDKDTISYWSRRASATNNPRMKARYAGLVWDFSEKVSGERAGYQTAQTYVGALLKIVPGGYYHYDVDVIPKLKRALSVAISLNKPTLIEEAKSAILQYENGVAVDGKPGLWGFSFDLLVGNEKVSLTDGEEREIIRVLEERMGRLKRGGDHWRCEMAAERLIRYYGLKEKEADRIRVVKTLGAAFEEAARTVNPLLASSWLEHIYPVYLQYGLRSEAEEVARRIYELGPEARSNMQSVSLELEFDKRQLEEHVESMVQGSLGEVLSRIAMQYIPNREEVEEQLRDLARSNPLSFMCSTKLIDYEGLTEALVGPLEDDIEGNVFKQITDNMLVIDIFLAKVIDRAIKKYNLQADSLLEYVCQSPIFSEKKRDLLRIGIQAYLSGSYAVSIHLIIPQLEAALRELVVTSGGHIMRSVRGGGFDRKSISGLLKTEQAIKILGNDVVTYLRVVLTDRRGWNVRNKVFHGIVSYENLSRTIADRVFHILLLLAQLRKGDE